MKMTDEAFLHDRGPGYELLSKEKEKKTEAWFPKIKPRKYK